MDSDMVERVAKAIDVAFIEWKDTPGTPPMPWNETLARAAIEAMREPTTAMLHASTMQVPTWDNDASRRKWQAMIDAALNQ